MLGKPVLDVNVKLGESEQPCHPSRREDARSLLDKVRNALCYKYRNIHDTNEAIAIPMKFFLYADNLNPTQLKRRAPEHKFQMLATLPDHTIQFCRWSSQWRCGLASVVPSAGRKGLGRDFRADGRRRQTARSIRRRRAAGSLSSRPGHRAQRSRRKDPGHHPCGYSDREIQTQGSLPRLGHQGPQALEVSGGSHRAMASLSATLMTARNPDESQIANLRSQSRRR